MSSLAFKRLLITIGGGKLHSATEYVSMKQETPLYKNHPEHLENIIDGILSAADPSKAVIQNLQVRGEILEIGKNRFPFQPGGRLFVVALGKASHRMIHI